jgi:FKBP-type peptidyl-prolyl cis-trans isomerase
MTSRFCRLLLLVLVGAGAPALHAQREKLPPDDLEFVEKTWPDAKKTNTGIRYVIEAEGKGDPARPGDLVSLLYAGRLLDGRVFDQNSNREQPFTFRVDRGMVIEGWDQIVLQMKVGERRVVIIPPELAYGRRGAPPHIPRNATLVFLLEIVDIKRE